jgi:uncharacterized protein
MVFDARQKRVFWQNHWVNHPLNMFRFTVFSSRRYLSTFLLLFLVPLAGYGAGKPFLWKIEGEKPSWLFGTIHIPDDRVLDLPANVQDAINGADAVYVEVNPDELRSPEMMNAMFLPGTQSLKSLFPEDLYSRCDAYLRKKGVAMVMFEKMRVWTFSVTLTMLDYMNQMGKGTLDEKVFRIGQAGGKEAGGLETAQEQLQVFESMSVDEQIELCRATLNELEKNPEAPMEKLILLYLEGDAGKISEEVNRQMGIDTEFGEKFTKLLLADRDQRMADRIEAKMKQNPGKSYFFAVGAAHLTDRESIPVLLERKGFKVARAEAPVASPQSLAPPLSQPSAPAVESAPVNPPVETPVPVH